MSEVSHLHKSGGSTTLCGQHVEGLVSTELEEAAHATCLECYRWYMIWEGSKDTKEKRTHVLAEIANLVAPASFFLLGSRRWGYASTSSDWDFSVVATMDLVRRIVRAGYVITSSYHNSFGLVARGTVKHDGGIIDGVHLLLLQPGGYHCQKYLCDKVLDKMAPQDLAKLFSKTKPNFWDILLDLARDVEPEE